LENGLKDLKRNMAGNKNSEIKFFAKDEEVEKAFRRYYSFLSHDFLKTVIIYDAVEEPDFHFFLLHTADEVKGKFVPVFIVNDYFSGSYKSIFFKIPEHLSILNEKIKEFSDDICEEFLANYVRYVLAQKGHGGKVDETQKFLIEIKNNKKIPDVKKLGWGYKYLKKFLLLSRVLGLSSSPNEKLKEIYNLVEKIMGDKYDEKDIDELIEKLNNFKEEEMIWKEKF
jgi:hypothetical protein